MDFILFLTLMALGYGFGRYAEQAHYKSIIAREKQLNSLPAMVTKMAPHDADYDAVMVCGNVVISVDYFKRFIAGLRNLVGGRVTSYETLLDRARREAVLRMKEEAASHNASYIFNVKFETASISQNARGGIGSVEVLAYGTALIAVTK